MIVERRSKKNFRDNVQHSYGYQENETKGFRFRALNNRNLNQELPEWDMADLRRNKGKEILIVNKQSKESSYRYNGRLEMNSKNKGKSKELGPKLGQVRLLEDLITLGQARSLLDQLGQQATAQKLLVGGNNSTGNLTAKGYSCGHLIGGPLLHNDRPSVNLSTPNSSMEGRSTDEVVVEDLGYCGLSFTWQKGGTFVRDLVSSDRRWNLNLFHVWLPEDVIHRIISIAPPHLDSGSNKRLLTNWECTRRGISQSNSCSVYGHEFEDMINVLRNCPAAKDDSRVTWSYLFGLIVWRIWKNNNLFIFQNIFWSATEVVEVSISWAHQFEYYFSVYKNNIPNLNPINIFDNIWVLLSTNSVVVREIGYAATGGAVRDGDGNWIMGFSRYLGVCSLFKAEVWGILDGILILLNKGYRRAIIQNDNLEVVQALTDVRLEDLGIIVLRRTQRIMRAKGQWRINHISIEQKLVADRLAKLSLNWKSAL
ncbi:hypothetical protein Goklo_014219 [Gossypium klotzschianum]|uniref:RNase H type-1 domain-containing protein n=1 Tax=Gossypium klotzschianum TaxID=34286 RepID=A0A7J8U723_9ROSI|nr:hypothetical protein [Gossypium klotzschianum]